MRRTTRQIVVRDTPDRFLNGRYTIGRPIGAGGMATVFLARDLRLDRDVAIKQLRRDCDSETAIERFSREIQVMARLQHPNLMPLFDRGETDGVPFYVMPYATGETLRARLQRERQLPVDDAIRLAVTIACALDHAHRHGVVHRDLKPENVLFHDGEPLVVDFGVAVPSPSYGGPTLTQSGTSVGTPQYMSPEQAAGDDVVDPRTDIYSLGALTYEMLAGEAPHCASTVRATIAKIISDEPKPLGTIRRTVPVHVDRAVLRALEKLPADRFSSMREFADALGGATKVVTPEYRTVSAWRQMYDTVSARFSLGTRASRPRSA